MEIPGGMAGTMDVPTGTINVPRGVYHSHCFQPVAGTKLWYNRCTTWYTGVVVTIGTIGVPATLTQRSDNRGNGGTISVCHQLTQLYQSRMTLLDTWGSPVEPLSFSRLSDMKAIFELGKESDSGVYTLRRLAISQPFETTAILPVL